MDIHVRHQQGESIRSIAKALNISRNTVRKYFRDAIKVPTYSERAPKLSKLEPFKPPVCVVLNASCKLVCSEIISIHSGFLLTSNVVNRLRWYIYSFDAKKKQAVNDVF